VGKASRPKSRLKKLTGRKSGHFNRESVFCRAETFDLHFGGLSISPRKGLFQRLFGIILGNLIALNFKKLAFRFGLMLPSKV